jgi:hypothetical protein
MEPTMDVRVGPQNGATGNLGPVVQIDEGRIQARIWTRWFDPPWKRH